MVSFKSARDLLLVGVDEGLLDKEEFLLLYDLNTSSNPEYPYTSYPEFDLQSICEAECKSEFRVEKRDIPFLADALGIPATVKCYQGTVCEREEALCILLQRFAYPCRYYDMISSFGRSVPELSMINNKMIDFIYNTHGHHVTQWNHQILNPEALETYAEVISAKGAALTNCFGFVDGTVRQISKPGKNQRIVYNGHKRVHTLKFQSVTLPNGLIANLYGPVEGRMHDARMLGESGLYENLAQFAFSRNQEPMCIYGDPAYPLGIHLQAPFRQAIMTQDMLDYNKSMSLVRVSVEWLFGDIVNYFKFIDFKKNLKIGLSQVGKMYIVCALLRNALTCLYKNNTSKYFNLDPPTLHEYFA